MQILVVTNEAPHHKFFAAHLAATHPVVAIVHPGAKPSSARKKLRREVDRNGLLYTTLRVLGRKRGWNDDADVAANEHAYFATAEESYTKLDQSLIRRVSDVNSPQGLEELRALAPDVVVCLGGAIYRKQFIEAFPLVVNYHSGFSPLYNGTDTIRYAFANGHPHLCGGTLMTMSLKIDGGGILAHFFPQIAPDDTPGSLFMKGVVGATRLTGRFLASLQGGGGFVSVPQGRPLFYARGHDFEICRNLRLGKYVRQGLAGEFARPEETVEYWPLPTQEAARELLRQTVLRRLGI